MVQRQVQLRLNPCCNGKGSKDRKKHKVLTLRLYAPQRDLASTGFNINYVPWKRVQSYEFIAICQRTNRLNIPKKASTAGKEAKTTVGQLSHSCVTAVLLSCDGCSIVVWQLPHNMDAPRLMLSFRSRTKQDIILGSPQSYGFFFIQSPFFKNFFCGLRHCAL